MGESIDSTHRLRAVSSRNAVRYSSLLISLHWRVADSSRKSARIRIRVELAARDAATRADPASFCRK